MKRIGHALLLCAVAERYGKKAAPDAQEPESRSFAHRSACRMAINYHTPAAISTTRTKKVSAIDGLLLKSTNERL